MLKYIMVFASVLMLVSAETYSTENDDLDIESVVNDISTLRAFINCFNDKGECNEVTADFKNDIKEAFEQECAKCTPAQKHIFKKFLEASKAKLADEYSYFLNKYDSQGKYIKPLQEAVSSF